MTGGAGNPVTLYVPVGTVITDFNTEEIVADLHSEGIQYVLKGGDGGRGNATYKTSKNRTPRFSQEGFPGIEMKLRLELKLLADVGLLGFPNAGKSTLISRISAAKPKIADYPFTTLVPNLGVVKVNDGESFVVADIPGLIEGASEGHGLGHQFLKHVERCRVFLHLVSPDEEEDTAADRYETIERELENYDASLLRRPRVTLLTKADLLSAEERESQIQSLKERSGGPVGVISSVSGEGLRALIYEIWSLLQSMEASIDLMSERRPLPNPDSSHQEQEE
jgi:GTP-binding protein